MLLNCSFDEWLEQGLEESKTLAPNPQSSSPHQVFEDSAIRWVGRIGLINELEHRLQEDCRVLSIVGITGKLTRS